MELFYSIFQVIFWAAFIVTAVVLAVIKYCGGDLSRNEEEIFERHIHEGKNDTQ